MTARPSLTLGLFGSPQIVLNGQLLDHFSYARSRALVCYLGVTNRVHSREALAELLWPEVAPQNAAKNLRNVLVDLRRQLGSVLYITPRMLGPAPDTAWRVESHTFENYVQAAQLSRSTTKQLALLHRALALYRGDFLDGFAINDAPAFNDWVEGERGRLRALALATLRILITQALHNGTDLIGINYATRLLELDPWHEETHHQLLVLLKRSGQRDAALAHFQRYAATLKRELGIEPTEELQQQARQVAELSLPAADAPLPVPLPHSRPQQLPSDQIPLFGRSVELAQVSHLLEQGQQLVTIAGLGGSGKTRLALEVATRWDASRPHDQAQDVLVVPLGEPIPLHTSAGNPMRDLAPAALLELLQRNSGRLGLVILDQLDHLPDNRALVRNLFQLAPDLRIVVTSRTRLQLRGEHVIWLRGLSCPTPEQQLTAADIRTYPACALFMHTAEALLPELPRDAATLRAIAQICRLLDGLPLAIEQAATLIRLLTCPELALELAHDMAVLETGAGSHSLQRILAETWACLTAEQQAALRLLAMLPQPIERRQLMALPQLSLTLLASLMEYSLLERLPDPANEAGGRYALPQLVQRFVVRQLAPGETNTGDLVPRNSIMLNKPSDGQIRRGIRRSPLHTPRARPHTERFE